jgi:glycosyltransferase involved in cell wall biosynthesis
VAPVSSLVPVRLALCCSESPGEIDGIRDYTMHLAEAIRANEGTAVDLYMRTPIGTWLTSPSDGSPTNETRSFSSGLKAYDAVVVQYNPFMYGRWGFAPWLPLGLWRMRRARSCEQIALMVHEPYVPMVNWRWALMGLWQRSQLVAALWGTQLAFASIQTWSASVGRLPFAPATHHLPVGSNLPDARTARRDERVRLRIGDNALIVAAFSTGVAGRLVSHVVAAVNEIARGGLEVVLLNLGAGAPPLRGSIASEVRVVEPGRLPPDRLARKLATADLFLAPFVDGVSSRRTTVMAALQHGIAVVGTTGPLTDELLISGDFLELAPVDDLGAFVRAALRLASNSDERRSLGEAGRKSYEDNFDWPVIARELLRQLATKRQEQTVGREIEHGAEERFQKFLSPRR